MLFLLPSFTVCCCRLLSLPLSFSGCRMSPQARSFFVALSFVEQAESRCTQRRVQKLAGAEQARACEQSRWSMGDQPGSWCCHSPAASNGRGRRSRAPVNIGEGRIKGRGWRREEAAVLTPTGSEAQRTTEVPGDQRPGTQPCSQQWGVIAGGGRASCSNEVFDSYELNKNVNRRLCRAGRTPGGAADRETATRPGQELGPAAATGSSAEASISYKNCCLTL